MIALSKIPPKGFQNLRRANASFSRFSSIVLFSDSKDFDAVNVFETGFSLSSEIFPIFSIFDNNFQQT